MAAVVVVPALTAPGNDSVGARLAESARDHGLGAVVTGLENLQYRLHPPRTGGALDPTTQRSLAADRPGDTGSTAAGSASGRPVRPTGLEVTLQLPIRP